MNAVGLGLVALLLCMSIVASVTAEAHTVSIYSSGADRPITVRDYDWDDGVGSTNKTKTLTTNEASFELDKGLWKLIDYRKGDSTIIYTDENQSYTLNDYVTLSVYVEDENGYPVEDFIVSAEGSNCTYRGITDDSGISEILVENKRFYEIKGDGIKNEAIYVKGNTSVDVQGDGDSDSPYLFDLNADYLGGSLLYTLIFGLIIGVVLIFLLGLSPLVSGVLGIVVIGALFLGMLVLPAVLILVVLIIASVMVVFFLASYVGKPLARGVGGSGRRRF